MLQTVSVSAFDRGGSQLTAAALKGWYVLAGAERPFTHELPEDICRKTRRLQVDVVSDQTSFGEVTDVPY
jgi:hypothetical protein